MKVYHAVYMHLEIDPRRGIGGRGREHNSCIVLRSLSLRAQIATRVCEMLPEKPYAASLDRTKGYARTHAAGYQVFMDRGFAVHAALQVLALRPHRRFD